MLKIFLSYARKDGAAAAARLRAELERAGFTVWRDIEEMRGGQAWKEQLRAALREVEAVLVLLTPGAVESQYVTWEWENALTLPKKVVPLLILPCDPPEELGRLHYHDLSHPDNYSLGFAALLRDLAETLAAQTGRDKPQTGPAGGDTFNVFGPKQSAVGPNATVINQGPGAASNGE
jgi:hypothetical protein